ncbi:ribulose-phosphate 3-epimerase [Cnuibacter physcomitrellae]|uniref:ribulose-phosphate 3-epimerase n=1 Tax=Cnuibacter physcomitrellae TaxID=1619308 RepID=UPI0021759F15|nr:ribulose-phosphate 3-epimerase [Cnuibacter physcomitrellae]MCS5496910.1 ribulose-phosphate 3-epimerase [Cnuibacter physcomitrellae]
MTLRINPSILASDFANLEAELGRIANADMAHVDVMDNHFVPNLTLGLPIVARLQEVSPIPLDVHLMIDDPDRWAPSYAETGAASVTFHAEAAADPRALARALRDRGARAGMAIKPGTAAEPFYELLPELDMLLVMTVEPGFGGQSFIESTMPKLRALRDEVGRRDLEIWLQVDGGINDDTIGIAAEAGADVFVAGSSVFGAEVAAEQVERLRTLAGEHSHS